MRSKLNKFLWHIQIEKGFSPGTIEAYRLDLGKGFIPFLHQRGKSEIGEVTKDDIRAYLDFLTTDRNNSIVTRARKLAAIKSFFNYLVENEELKTNAASSIKGPKIPEREPAYLTEDECIRLLESVARSACPKVSERDMAIILLFLHLGLRVSELTNLKLANVDLGIAQIKITRKGNKEQYLHLNGEAATALANYLASRPKAQDGRFFVGTNGGNLDRIRVYNIVRRYMKLANIDKPNRGPHILRHTFCTRLHQKGVGTFTIKDLAGHKSINTTMRYINIDNKEQAEAIDRLEFGIL
ncbi:MAG: tyrosine-type recombinase/integrase [Dehalococcoidia bacterium]|nr:tyrosine-type recombinase/integrase [Dehalococcoidia bacterium]